MRNTLLTFALLVPVLMSCTETHPFEFSDDEILKLVYSDYKFPEGFYTEETDSGSFYYENTVSIKALNEREAVWIELSTNSRDTARYWSEQSALNSAYYRRLVSERETEKFFEFRRVWEQHPGDVILSRVHKRGYLDRSMYDSFNKGAVVGRYNVRPMTVGGVRELIEYLVFVNEYNNGSYKVLSSGCREEESFFLHTLTELIISYGDWGLNDRITVRRAYYRVDKSSGEIHYSTEEIQTLQGRANGGGLVP